MSARIIIAEDESIGAMYLRRTLEGFGHRVLGIEETGEGVVGRALACKPDLVVMDVRLKGDMDGVTAAKIPMCPENSTSSPQTRILRSWPAPRST